MTNDEDARPVRRVSRRGLLLATTGGALVLAGGTAIVLGQQPSTPGAGAPSERQSPVRLGAMVAAPENAEGVARWREDVDLLAAHGQNLIRTGIYAWMVAPQPDQWASESVAFFREAFAYARERGLAINMVVPGAPDWAQNFDFEQYANTCRWFWTRMRENFGDQVDLWQVYNEADHAHYQKFTPAIRDARYLGEFAHMLGIAKDVFGGFGGRPITTNLTGWPMNDEREQEWYQVLDAIGAPLDVLGIDLYPADNEAEIARLADRMRRVSERYRKPIFVAEIGLQTTPGSWTEEDQRRHVAAAIGQLRTVELWGISLYELRDSSSPGGFGIQRQDGSRKLGFGEVMRAMSPR